MNVQPEDGGGRVPTPDRTRCWRPSREAVRSDAAGRPATRRCASACDVGRICGEVESDARDGDPRSCATALCRWCWRKGGRVDKLRKQDCRQVGAGGALDLDAARAEIGRRLACLRDAGGSGRVSGGLSQNALLALPWLFEFWALPHQLPPRGRLEDLGHHGRARRGQDPGGGGMGARAGRRGEAADDRGVHAGRAGRRDARPGARGDGVRGQRDPGLLAARPAPGWQATRKRLVWPNGAVAQVFSAHDPESLRGPQFDAAWVDELAKWKKADEAWDMLQFALRLGEHPRQVVTTTPRERAGAEGDPGEAHDGGDAGADRGEPGLSGGELPGARCERAMPARGWGGRSWTASWSRTSRARCGRGDDRGGAGGRRPSVQPDRGGGRSAGDGHGRSDDCGIVVVGCGDGGPAAGLAGRGDRGRQRAGRAPAGLGAGGGGGDPAHGADRLVAEVNQGGDLVETLVRQVDPLVPFASGACDTAARWRGPSRWRRSTSRGGCSTCGGLGALEDQMCRMTVQGYQGEGSPDRVDALVWAMTDLMIEPAQRALRATRRAAAHERGRMRRGSARSSECRQGGFGAGCRDARQRIERSWSHGVEHLPQRSRQAAGREAKASAAGRVVAWGSRGGWPGARATWRA